MSNIDVDYLARRARDCASLRVNSRLHYPWYIEDPADDTAIAEAVCFDPGIDATALTAADKQIIGGAFRAVLEDADRGEDADEDR